MKTIFAVLFCLAAFAIGLQAQTGRTCEANDDNCKSRERESLTVNPDELKKPESDSREAERKTNDQTNPLGQTRKNESSDNEDDSSPPAKIEKFHWKAALIQSGIVLGVQHGFRMLQTKTRREFEGPFFRDWKNSVKNLRGWRDGDNNFTNYVAHPLQGAVTGRVFINNSDRALKQEFGKSRAYVTSRLKTLAWAAVWSAQFEIGPISEANLGNVGLKKKSGYSTMAYVDLVITPIAGTGIVVAEDAIDKYILKNWLERKAGGRLTNKIRLFRCLLTPATSISNLLRAKVPWHRDFR